MRLLFVSLLLCCGCHCTIKRECSYRIENKYDWTNNHNLTVASVEYKKTW